MMTRVIQFCSGRVNGFFLPTGERPEQVAPFSILNNFVDYLPHSILLYWFIMDGRWEHRLFNRYKDKKKKLQEGQDLPPHRHLLVI